MCVSVGGTYFCINLIVPHKFIFGHSCNMLSLLYCVLADGMLINWDSLINFKKKIIIIRNYVPCKNLMIKFCQFKKYLQLFLAMTMQLGVLIGDDE